MALAQPLVAGQNEEWALVRRHKSEKMFGVQVAGGYPNRMVPVAEMISKEIAGGVDFVDVNMASRPLDSAQWADIRDVQLISSSIKELVVLVRVLRNGFFCAISQAVLDSPGRLGKILVGMNRALGDSEPPIHHIRPDTDLSPAYCQIRALLRPMFERN